MTDKTKRRFEMLKDLLSQCEVGEIISDLVQSTPIGGSSCSEAVSFEETVKSLLGSKVMAYLRDETYGYGMCLLHNQGKNETYHFQLANFSSDLIADRQELTKIPYPVADVLINLQTEIIMSKRIIERALTGEPLSYIRSKLFSLAPFNVEVSDETQPVEPSEEPKFRKVEVAEYLDEVQKSAGDYLQQFQNNVIFQCDPAPGCYVVEAVVDNHAFVLGMGHPGESSPRVNSDKLKVLHSYVEEGHSKVDVEEAKKIANGVLDSLRDFSCVFYSGRDGFKGSFTALASAPPLHIYERAREVSRRLADRMGAGKEGEDDFYRAWMSQYGVSEGTETIQ